ALFLNMSRYSGGQDNEFWLEAWNGDSYTVERMGRPPIVVDHLLVGVVGGLQPDKLARSFKGDLDGMYARVLFAWPPEPGYRRLTNDVAEIEPEIYNALTRIVGLDGGHDADGGLASRFISLSPEAIEHFEHFRHFAHQERAGLDAREGETWAKAPSQGLRLTGTWTYLDWAMSGGEEPSLVNDAFMKNAVRLVRDYFWPHSRAALRQIGLSERHANARRVLHWIRKNNKTEVSRQDIRATLSAKVSTPIRHRPLLMVWLGPAGSVRSRPRRRAALVTDGKLIRSCSYAVLREVQKVRKDYELSTFSRFLHFAQWYLKDRYNGHEPRQEE